MVSENEKLRIRAYVKARYAYADDAYIKDRCKFLEDYVDNRDLKKNK